MKKILALLLALTCIFSVFACQNDPADQPSDDAGNNGTNPPADDNDTTPPADEMTVLERFSAMLRASTPTKSVVTATETFSKNVLTSVTTLATGTTVEGLEASVLEIKKQTLNDADGTTLELVGESVTEHWYLEGRGLSTNKGRKWDANGTNFAPKENALRLYLNEEFIDSYEYDEATETLVLNVTWEYASDVLAYFLPTADYALEQDVKITITAAADRVTGITIEYFIESDEIGDITTSVEIPKITVVVDAKYTYDIEEITFD